MKAQANVIAQHIGFVDQLGKTAINVEDILTDCTTSTKPLELKMNLSYEAVLLKARKAG